MGKQALQSAPSQKEGSVCEGFFLAGLQKQAAHTRKHTHTDSCPHAKEYLTESLASIHTQVDDRGGIIQSEISPGDASHSYMSVMSRCQHASVLCFFCLPSFHFPAQRSHRNTTWIFFCDFRYRVSSIDISLILCHSYKNWNLLAGKLLLLHGVSQQRVVIRTRSADHLFTLLGGEKASGMMWQQNSSLTCLDWKQMGHNGEKTGQDAPLSAGTKLTFM